MKRLLALVCVLLLAVGMVSFASAEKVVAMQETKGMDFDNSIYLVKNGETAKFILFSSPYSLYTPAGDYYGDIDFDCDGAVKGKVLSGSDWITVTNTARDCKIRIGENETMKQRVGKVQVTGKKYKATVVFTQYGRDRIDSAVRNKNKITLTLRKGSGPKYHVLSVRQYKFDGEMWDYDEYSYKLIYDDNYTKAKYTFKVKAGCVYDFSYCPGIKTEWGYSTSGWGYAVEVSSVTGSDTWEFFDY